MKDWRREEKGTTEDEIIGWHHQLNGHEFEQAPGVGDGQAGLACCSPWGHKELDVTERLNWSTICLSIHLLMDIRAVPSRIVESYYNCTFIILRTHHTVFHGGFTILHFHVQCTRVSISPYPHKTCYFVLFFSNSNTNRYEVVSHGFWLAFP